MRAFGEVDGRQWRVVASGMFGGYADVEAMGIDGLVRASICLDQEIERRRQEADR